MHFRGTVIRIGAAGLVALTLSGCGPEPVEERTLEAGSTSATASGGVLAPAGSAGSAVDAANDAIEQQETDANDAQDEE